MPQIAVDDSVVLTARINPEFGCTLLFDFEWTALTPTLVEVRKTSDTTAVVVGRQPGPAQVRARSLGPRPESMIADVTVR